MMKHPTITRTARRRPGLVLVLAGLLAGSGAARAANLPGETALPAPAVDTPALEMSTPDISTPGETPGLRTAIFAGGCFWGV